MIRIRGEKVALRPLRPDEVDVLVEESRRVALPEGVRRPSREAIKRRIACSGRFVRGRLALGIEAERRLVGDVDARSPAGAFPPGVFEIGVSVFDEQDRGRGFGLEATRLLVDHLFDAEEAARVQASTAGWNLPMRALLRRLGFREEGVLRSYYPTSDGRDDYVMCSLTREEWLAGDAWPLGSAPVELEHVLVVGAGQMGGGIAQVVATSGRHVSLHDAAPGAVERGLAAMRKSLTRLAEKGGPEPDEVLARIEPADDLVPADLMVEAVVEDAGVKEDVFRRADAILPEGAILASNTSSIPITTLAAATSRPDRVIGMHFFNPVPVLRLVEVVRGRETSDETAGAVTRLAEDLGKTPAVANDFPGFVSNRILMPYVNEAVWALHEGVAEAEAIDTIAKLGFAHPMGPLALADLIGLDTCVAIMEVLHEGLGSDKYAPCPLLVEHVEAGRLGRKSGRGFFEYHSG